MLRNPRRREAVLTRREGPLAHPVQRHGATAAGAAHDDHR